MTEMIALMVATFISMIEKIVLMVATFILMTEMIVLIDEVITSVI